MSKFFRLCSCEFIKIMKKKSSKVMLIILIASIFAAAGLTVLTKNLYSATEESVASSDYQASLKKQLELLKADYEANKDSFDESTQNSKLAEIDMYQVAIDLDINVYNSYWKSNVLANDVYFSKVAYYNYKSMGEEELAEKEQADVDKKIELIKNDNFDGYIDLQKEIVQTNFETGFMDKTDYDNAMHVLDLRQKYQVGKEFNTDDTWKETVVEEIEVLNDNIKYGIDTISQKSLSEKELQDAKNSIMMNEYRLEHNMPPYMTATSIGNKRKIFDYMQGGMTTLVIAVMIIIMAGSAVSSEVSKGTIKFWSFTPYKRWKILLSKLVVITAILVVVTVLVSLLSSLIGNLFFGSADAQGYLYVSGGEIHYIHYIPYVILYNLSSALEIFIFLLLALMLSTVTRNTAVSVGVSIATYFGGSVIMQLINSFIKADWLKFIPFNNLSLTDRIFTNDISYSASTIVSKTLPNIPVSFSLKVLGVFAVIMIVTMFDSFRKRDIM